MGAICLNFRGDHQKALGRHHRLRVVALVETAAYDSDIRQGDRAGRVLTEVCYDPRLTWPRLLTGLFLSGARKPIRLPAAEINGKCPDPLPQ
jgi:hypothetical protein